MNARKFNYDLIEISIETVMKMVESLDNPIEMPEEQVSFYMVKVASNRKPIRNKPYISDQEVFIKIFLDTMPNVTVDELKKRGKKQDSKALLSLGDCYYFGLKDVDENRVKAKSYYLSSANLNNPEAMTMVAYCCYKELLDLIHETDNPDIQHPTFAQSTSYLSFPQHIARVQNKTLLDEMWDWLEKCVSVNWISSFLIHQASDVLTYRSQDERLRPSIKRELIKYNVEQQQEIEKNFPYSCSNSSCKFRFEQESSLLKTCNQCKTVKYCNEKCQEGDIQKHKDVCKPADQSQIILMSSYSDSNDEKPVKALFSMNGPNNQTIYYETKTASLNRLKLLQHELKPDDAHNVIMAETRMASVRNLNMNEHQIEQEIVRLMNRSNYPASIKFINFAMDKIRLRSIISIERLDKVKLIELYYKRVQCYLNIAQLRRETRFKKMALDDCIVVLDMCVFGKIECEAYRKLEEIKFTLENDQITRTNVEPIRRRRRRQRPNRYRQNGQQDIFLEEFEELAFYGEIEVTTCSKLLSNKMAVNSQIDMEYCPICCIKWADFIEPSLAVILPCKHAFCAKCILNYSNVCQAVRNQNEEEEEEVPNDSCCSLCRHEFSPAYLDDICNSILSEKAVESLFKNSEKLGFEKKEGEKFICNLLIKNEFDINKIEGILFNMIGMIEAETNRDSLDSEEKQKYFEIARAPVKNLTNQYYELKKEIDSIHDTSSVEWQTKFKQLNELKNNLNIARQNAANDIYERLNSTNKMGCVLNDKAIVQIDLHALFVDEAIGKVEDVVIPILSVLGKIKIITGHGVHNKSGKAILKNELKEFFRSKNIKCKDLDDNRGAILVFQDE